MVALATEALGMSVSSFACGRVVHAHVTSDGRSHVLDSLAAFALSGPYMKGASDVAGI